MILDICKKRNKKKRYILSITLEKSSLQTIIDLHLKRETYMSSFMSCQVNQSTKVLIYEVIPRVATSELAHSILAINSVIMVSINRKEN